MLIGPSSMARDWVFLIPINNIGKKNISIEPGYPLIRKSSAKFTPNEKPLPAIDKKGRSFTQSHMNLRFNLKA